MFKKVKFLMLTMALMLCAACQSNEGETTKSPDVTTESGVKKEDTTPAVTEGTNSEAADSTEKDFVTAEDVRESYREHFEKLSEEYASRVITLESGVQIKRTPDTSDVTVNTHGALTDYMSYNNIYLNADNRGCGACHTDLAQLVDNMYIYPHAKMSSELEIEYTVQQCMNCHDWSSSIYDEPEGTFGSLMHTIHSSKNTTFTAMMGDCWSCHYATEDGQGLQLWDNVKHKVLRGITAITSEEVSYSFDWTQDKVVSVDALFDINWFYSEPGTQRWAAGLSDLEPNPGVDGVYEQWTIECTGDITNAGTYTLAELIKAVPPTEAIMGIECGINPIGGSWVGNCQIKGISLVDLLKYLGAYETAKTVEYTATDGVTYFLPIEWIEERGAYLTLEIDGETLSYRQGYPVQLWASGTSAWNYLKEIVAINVISEEYPMEYYMTGMSFTDGLNHSKPSVGICHLREGQIIPADSSYTFEGYLNAWETPIAALEVSFDLGETWITCETVDAVPQKWVYWYFTWTPPQAGAYTITVRGVDADGTVSPEWIEFMVNAE